MSWLPAIRWVHGLVGAFVGGGASAITATWGASMIAPDKFNGSHEGVQAMLTLVALTFCVNGGLSAAFYLKQAPVPNWNGADRRRLDGDTGLGV